jgi:hypothetical protein
MAAYIGRDFQDIPTLSSGIVTTYFIYRAMTKYSWAIQCIKTVKIRYINHNRDIVL